MAIAEYQIKILNHDGDLVAILDKWNTLEYELLHNDIGNHTLTLDLNDVKVEFFQLDYFVQVWRKPPGGVWAIDYDGFHRTPQQTISENNLELFTSYGKHINDVLHRRTILYFAGTDYTNKSGPVDDVMKAYVEENAGATATTNPDRMRNILTPIYVAANEGLGPNWEGQRSFKRLSDVLKELGTWSTYRFYIDRDVDEEFGPDTNALVFRTFEKRQELRQGFSAIPVVFSPQLGNMRAPSHTVSRIDEIQAVVALGQGEGEDRIFLEELGENVADSPYNDIEYAEDARQEELTAGLEVAALTVLAENGPQESLEFEVVQIPSCLYGKHYGLSDYVSGNFLGVTKDYRIIGVTVRVADGQETITCRFQVVKHVFNLAPGDISSGTGSKNPLADIINNLSLRLRELELREVFAGFSSVPIPPTVQIPFTPTGSVTADTLAAALAQIANNQSDFRRTLFGVFLPDSFILPPSGACAGIVDVPTTNFPIRGAQFDPSIDSEMWLYLPVDIRHIPIFAGMALGFDATVIAKPINTLNQTVNFKTYYNIQTVLQAATDADVVPTTLVGNITSTWPAQGVLGNWESHLGSAGTSGFIDATTLEAQFLLKISFKRCGATGLEDFDQPVYLTDVTVYVQ